MKTNNSFKAVTIALSCLLVAGGLTFIHSSESKAQETKAEIDPTYGKPIYNSGNKTITYGLYPKTVVVNTDLIAALDALGETPDDPVRGWYLYEGNYYKKLSSASNVGEKYSTGTTIESGVPYWFKCEPIVWNVLKTTGTRHIAISSLVIDQVAYGVTYKRTIDSKTIYANNYKYSNVRAFLNGYDGSSYDTGNYTGSGFIDIAFGLDTVDSSYIYSSTIDNSAATTGDKSNPYACENTVDKVYLLSYKELTSYFNKASKRRIKPTDYGLARDVYFYDNYGYWLLRSPSTAVSGGTVHLDVQGDGQVSYEFPYGGCYSGIRPVMLFNTINANDVIDRINNIGTVECTSACKASIDSARTGYNSLDDEQKALVTNYDVLEAAETSYNNMSAAASVINLIDAIGTVTYSSSKTPIQNARDGYDALTDDQKGLVTNLDTLTAAETAYNQLRDAAVANVINLINEIGEVSYPEPDSGADINAARTAYNNLDSDDVSLVTNYDTLVEDEATYKDLKDNYLANNVKGLINDIGEVTYSEESKTKIDEARGAYDALSDDQKDLVVNYQTLVDAETAYSNLDTAVNEVDTKINSIGEVTYTDECKAKIDDARTSYDELNDLQKEAVDNYQVLEDAEKAYQKFVEDHIAANNVIEKIDAIGEVEFTTSCKARIDDAREGYDSLSDDQELIVGEEKYEVLVDAEEAYATLAHEGSGSRSDDTNGVSVETSDGTTIPTDISLKVEVKTDIKASEGSTEYQNIQSKLGSDEQISNVFDIKLIKIEGEIETEIQPSEIEPGMKLVINISLPEGIDTSALKLLHIHSESDIEFVESFQVVGNKIVFEVSSLSEIAFVTKVPAVPKSGLPGWAIALIVIGSILLLLCGAYFLLFFVFNKWIKEEDKALRVLPFAFGNKDGKQRLFAFPCKLVYREKEEIYATKEEALKESK